MIGDNLQQYTYDNLMRTALSFVPDDLDKRQGSVIYDALAPFCQLLAAGALQLREYYTQTYAVTATGQDLDNRVAEQGIKRYQATKAIKKLELADKDGNPVIVPLGTRFSTVSTTNPINYAITSQYSEDNIPVPGAYEATCEEVGTVGNQYSGNMLNIAFIQGLASAELSTTLVPAQNEETDDELRARYFETLNQKAFGGNIADYRTKVEALSGVGAVQIYPTWNGGGTVKLSIVDGSYSPCSEEFVASVQNIVDPEESGSGIGLAPIGHKVTITTPQEAVINVSATLTLQAGYTLGHVQSAIESALAEYIYSLKMSWADSPDLINYTCDIFVSKVTAALVSIRGVANAYDVKLNNSSEDIILAQTGTLQQIPKLGEVILNV